MSAKKKTRAELAIANKRKGNSFEREIMHKFKLISEDFQFCKTSRLASRLYDNCSIDLHGIPYLVQAKNVQSALNYGKIFEEMEQAIKDNFPSNAVEHKLPKVIFHKRKKDRLVILKEEDFLELLSKLHGKNS